MGATGWNYFTPWQSDVEQALQSLRNEVFAKGEYGEEFWDSRKSDYYSLPDELKWAFKGMYSEEEEEKFVQHFNSIEELLEECAEEGTHSILDIIKTGEKPDFGIACPAPEKILTKLYGTTKPTHEQIAEKDMELTEELGLGRWEAVYVTVYTNGSPAEYYFEGISGD